MNDAGKKSRTFGREMYVSAPPGTDRVDASALTDSDWTEMSALMRVYEARGEEALLKAMNELKDKDPNCFSRIVGALKA